MQLRHENLQPHSINWRVSTPEKAVSQEMFTARKQDACLFVLFFKSSATGLLYLICVLHSWPSLTLLAMDVEPMSRSKLLPNPQHSRYLQNHVSLNSAANPIFGKLLSSELTPALRAQGAAAVSTSALAV